jgi:hypothetical protein
MSSFIDKNNYDDKSLQLGMAWMGKSALNVPWPTPLKRADFAPFDRLLKLPCA